MNCKVQILSFISSCYIGTYKNHKGFKSPDLKPLPIKFRYVKLISVILWFIWTLYGNSNIISLIFT